MQLIADYTSKTKRYPASLMISQLVNGQRHVLRTIECAGKAQARKLAEQLGAIPWNF